MKRNHSKQAFMIFSMSSSSWLMTSIKTPTCMGFWCIVVARSFLPSINDLHHTYYNSIACPRTSIPWAQDCASWMSMKPSDKVQKKPWTHALPQKTTILWWMWAYNIHSNCSMSKWLFKSYHNTPSSHPPYVCSSSKHAITTFINP